MKAVFIDRDGVINNDEDHYYIYKIEDFKINNGVLEGLKMLSDAGFQLFVVTNQGGIAKGVYSSEDVALLHNHLKSICQKNGSPIVDIAFCPHHESIATCDCRKPSPKMILDLVAQYNINKDESFLIGDSKRDIEAGNAAGLKQCFKINANENIIPICQKIIELSK